MLLTSRQSTSLCVLLLIVTPGYTAKTIYTDDRQPISRIPNISYQGTLLRPEKPRRKPRRKLYLLSMDYNSGIKIRNNRMFFPITEDTSGMLSLSPDRIKIKLFMGNENTRLELRGDKKKIYLKFKFYF